MSAGKKLLDKYAETCLAKSDAELGRNLKVTRAAVNNWRKGTAHPDADSIEKMAQAIGEPVGPWLARIEAERARTPAARMVWLRLAATLGASLALAGLTIALPDRANATQSMTAYCVKFTRRLVASLWDAARSILRGDSHFEPYQAHMAAQALA